VSCCKCHGTGVIESGNNDFPCDCPAGDVAVFNVASLKGPVTKRGREIRASGSVPERNGFDTVRAAPTEPLVEEARKSHDEMVAKRIFDAFDKHIRVPPELEAKLLALIERELKGSR